MNYSTLASLGLTIYQIKIYEDFLKNGEQNPAELAGKLNYDKSTVYRSVDELEELGLLVKIPKKRGSTYKATDPEVLNILANKEKQAADMKARNIAEVVEDLQGFAVENNENLAWMKVEKGVDAQRNAMEAQLSAKELPVR
ncbi:MAG: helix-turn-helix domain-containing protein [Candidatus Dojkabacteria bacterium]|nr:helix-turn-helix domain-containing protein [Candidatus Dojkabacteria bacterium]MDQ7021030.1 helix-turn-helix domain-containing protein [Candidatus Dojkabacteria bacterium]